MIEELKMNISGKDKENYLKAKAYILKNVTELKAQIKGAEEYKKSYQQISDFWRVIKEVEHVKKEFIPLTKFIDENYEKQEDTKNKFLNSLEKAQQDLDKMTIKYNKLFTEEIIDNVAVIPQETVNFCNNYVDFIVE